MTQPQFANGGAPPSRRQANSASPTPERDNEAGVDLKKLKDELTCSICLEICIRPCSTPCGHSFCRRCIRDALTYSPKCPKCRDVLPPGFALNVNSVLWNTIRMLFPETTEAPASPPASSTIRRAMDRRHLREILAAGAEVRRRSLVDRARQVYPQSSTLSRSQTGEPHDSHRRRRMSHSTQGRDDGDDSRDMVHPPPVTSNGQPVASTLSRTHHAADSIGGSAHLSAGLDQDRNHHLRHRSRRLSSRHGYSSTPFDVRALTNRQTSTNETSDHREDNYVQEMLSSADYSWFQPLNGQRRRASGVRNGHGFGVANALTRSASHGDLHNGVEYVTVQRVQRVDEGPSHRRHGVYRFDNYTTNNNRDRFLQQFRRRPEQTVPDFESRPPIDARSSEYDEERDFEEEDEDDYLEVVEDEDDYETASEIISDRDLSFTSTTAASAAALFSGNRMSTASNDRHGHISNANRYHEHVVVAAAAAAAATSPSSTAAATQSATNSESTIATISGCERLYDIAPQIEAAMLDIERLSLQFGRTRHSVTTTQAPATPLTHRSCFQLSDDEEEEVEWNARLRDAVFIVDDVDTDSDSESESEPDEASSAPASPFDDVELDVALHHMADAQWISSVEEDPYSYY